jgi:hypothetical protein
VYGVLLRLCPSVWTAIDDCILLAAGLARFGHLIAAVTKITEVDDTRGLLHLLLPAALITVAAALTHHRARI